MSSHRARKRARSRSLSGPQISRHSRMGRRPSQARGTRAVRSNLIAFPLFRATAKPPYSSQATHHGEARGRVQLRQNYVHLEWLLYISLQAPCGCTNVTLLDDSLPAFKYLVVSKVCGAFVHWPCSCCQSGSPRFPARMAFIPPLRITRSLMSIPNLNGSTH